MNDVQELLNALPGESDAQHSTQNGQEASLSTLDLPETLSARTAKIFPGQSHCESVPLSPASSFEKHSIGIAQRSIPTSEARPSEFLGGSGEFNCQPRMRASKQCAPREGDSGMFSKGAIEPELTLRHPTSLGAGVEKDNSMSKLTAPTMDTSMASFGIAEDGELEEEDGKFRVVKYANGSIASLAITEEEDSSARLSINTSIMDNSTWCGIKKDHKKRQASGGSRTPLPDGGRRLPTNSPRDRRRGPRKPTRKPSLNADDQKDAKPAVQKVRPLTPVQRIADTGCYSTEKPNAPSTEDDDDYDDMPPLVDF